MSTKLKNFKEAPFYFSPLFSRSRKCFSFFIIPFFIAIILVCLRSRRYVSIESSQLIELENIQEQIATASERLQNLQASYTEKNKELEDQYAQKNKHLENEYIQRKEILDKEHQHLSKELAAKTKQEKSVLEAIKSPLMKFSLPLSSILLFTKKFHLQRLRINLLFWQPMNRSCKKKIEPFSLRLVLKTLLKVHYGNRKINSLGALTAKPNL